MIDYVYVPVRGVLCEGEGVIADQDGVDAAYRDRRKAKRLCEAEERSEYFGYSDYTAIRRLEVR